jgi:hypothetical protein
MASSIKTMASYQNKYNVGSLSHSLQNQVKSLKLQGHKMLPGSNRAIIMNPSLAISRRVPQPAMIAKAAEFTVQQSGRIAVKSNHMDKEVSSTSKT